MYRISPLQVDANESGQTGEVPPLHSNSPSKMHCQSVPGTVSDICDQPRSPTLLAVLISRKIIHMIVYNIQVETCNLNLGKCLLRSSDVSIINFKSHTKPNKL